MAIPLPVQPVGCEGRRRNGSLPVAPLLGVHPQGSCPDQHPGHGSPLGKVGLDPSRQAPKAVSNLLLEQPFPGHLPACPKSTVLCDLPAGRALLGAREAAGPQGRGWGNLSPDVGSGKARVGWEWKQGASHNLAVKMCQPGQVSFKDGLL